MDHSELNPNQLWQNLHGYPYPLAPVLGGGTVNVRCDTHTNSGTARSGSITVKTASGLTKTVSLSQAAANLWSIQGNVQLINNSGTRVTGNFSVTVTTRDSKTFSLFTGYIDTNMSSVSFTGKVDPDDVGSGILHYATCTTSIPSGRTLTFDLISPSIGAGKVSISGTAPNLTASGSITGNTSFPGNSITVN